MRPFLQQVVDTLLRDHGADLSPLSLVLPSRRAGIFIRKYLGESTGRATWGPRILTIDEFLREQSGYHIPEEINLLFLLYASYLKVADPEYRESLDSFTKWGRTFLHDVNEVDNHLIPGEQLFSGIREVRAIENWSLNEPDLTEGQERFVRFWEMLGNLYTTFREDLENREKAYPGMALRSLAEDPSPCTHSFANDSVCFIGLNALSKAQETLIRYFLKKGKGIAFWDADPYYLEDPDQEAGLFLRRIRDQWTETDRMYWFYGHLTEARKHITITGVPKAIGQVKTACRSLPEDAALVLADESLLLPVLNSLPASVTTLNITMEYPLEQTALHDFFNALFTLRENATRIGNDPETGAPLYHHEDVARILRHPYFTSLAGGNPNVSGELLAAIKQRNIAFLTPDDLAKHAADHSPERHSLISLLFTPWHTIPTDILNGFTAISESLKEVFGRAPDRRLEREYLFEYARVLTKLSTLLEEHPYVDTLTGFKRIFERAIKGAGTAFYGEPLQGTQVMGMLETRTLDFREVILLGANEGDLPGIRKEDSLIPFDLQRAYGLPTYREKEAIHAYHFYRLIQRAERVRIWYDTEEEGFGASEKSRFLTQLLHEFPEKNPEGTIEHSIARPITRIPPPAPTCIEKDGAVQEALEKRLEKGVSPSALNTYVRCPLDFYYKYLIGLEEPEEVEETMEGRTLGLVAHKVLEEQFQPWKGRVLPPEKLREMREETPKRVREAFKEAFPEREVERGKNLLLSRMTEKSLIWLLQKEEEVLKEATQRGEELTILELEEKYEKTLEVPVNGKTLQVPLRGKADRIDRLGNTVRIIDYKSGVVNPRELKVSDISAMTRDPAKDKCFQLMTYAWLYGLPSLETQNLRSGICSLRKPAQGMMPLLVNKEDRVTEAWMRDFEGSARELVEEILNPEIPFQHRTESTYCPFCTEDP